jgi:hypothetical protein
LAADPDYDGIRRLSEPEVGTGSSSPVTESRSASHKPAVVGSERKPGQGVQCLTGDPEAFATGGDDGQSGTCLEQLPSQGRGDVEEVLAIIQDQQGRADPEAASYMLDQAELRMLVGPCRPGHGAEDLMGVSDRCELGQPDPCVVERTDFVRDLECQPAPACPAGADHGHQARVLEEVPHPGPFGGPADEGGEPSRQVVRGVVGRVTGAGAVKDGSWRRIAACIR